MKRIRIADSTKIIMLLILIFIMIIGGNTYAWRVYTAQINTGEESLFGLPKMFVKIGYLGEQGEEIKLGDDVDETSLALTFDNTDSNGETTMPAFFKIDISGDVVDSAGVKYSKDVADLISEGIIAVRCEQVDENEWVLPDADQFKSVFNAKAEPEFVWLVDRGYNERLLSTGVVDFRGLYCYLGYDQIVNVKFTFSFVGEAAQLQDLNGLRIHPRVTALATNFTRDAITRNIFESHNNSFNFDRDLRLFGDMSPYTGDTPWKNGASENKDYDAMLEYLR